EERPKVIVGLSRLPDEALQLGLLRDDLSYRLRLARVNLDSEALRETLPARRRKLEEKLAAAKELLPSKPAKRAKPPAPRPKKSSARRPASRPKRSRPRPAAKRSAKRKSAMKRRAKASARKARPSKKSGKRRR